MSISASFYLEKIINISKNGLRIDEVASAIILDELNEIKTKNLYKI